MSDLFHAETHSYALLLGLTIRDWPLLNKAVGEGFAYDTFEHLRRNSGLSSKDLLHWLQIAPRTLTQRKQQGQFAPHESDRLLRAARVLGKAIALFDSNREAALEWLRSSLPALRGESPFDVATTDLGAREVENLIGRLEHGVYS